MLWSQGSLQNKTRSTNERRVLNSKMAARRKLRNIFIYLWCPLHFEKGKKIKSIYRARGWQRIFGGRRLCERYYYFSCIGSRCSHRQGVGWCPKLKKSIVSWGNFERERGEGSPVLPFWAKLGPPKTVDFSLKESQIWWVFKKSWTATTPEKNVLGLRVSLSVFLMPLDWSPPPYTGVYSSQNLNFGP